MRLLLYTLDIVYSQQVIGKSELNKLLKQFDSI